VIEEINCVSTMIVEATH